ncbi:MAG: adenylosuccinate synthase [Flavobacteriales bacterium]|nr:adenylosuccinate synthase [Flavobacteriales bacterium]
MAVDIILGLQWGDEGKGKIVDALTTQYDIIARFQGGPNAGHTLIFGDIKHVLHTIPSGIFHKKSINVVGNGVVVDPLIFIDELKKLEKFNLKIEKRLFISKKTHLILPTHRLLDQASEKSKGKLKIGSTLKGIGPTYMDKTGRNGIRVGDLEHKDWKKKYLDLKQKHLKLIKNMNVELSLKIDEIEKLFFESIEYLISSVVFIDSEEFLYKSQKNGLKILAEGAQGSLLDIDFGTYPYVTSSNTTAAGACTGLGISPKKINEVYGVFKAYTTRVGSGPFPTEISGEIGEKISVVGKEFGSTTGRARRCGWLDLVALKYAIQINGVTKLAMMKGDVLSGINEIKICTSYNYLDNTVDFMPYSLDKNHTKANLISMPGWDADLSKINKEENLPLEFLDYIKFIEDEVGVPITIVSIGPDRNQTIFR